MPSDDITNVTLGRLISVEVIASVITAAFFAGVIWITLTTKVEANAQNDKAIISKQAEFADSINDISTTQEVIQVEIGNIQDNQDRQQQDINYLKSQSDEIKTLLININRNQ
tara:strand:+ start:18169 stop:18504 length:336 start_codon:yes stop_codon:yes gene_type:complete